MVAEAVLAALLDSRELRNSPSGDGNGDLWAVNDRLGEILGQGPDRLRELSHLEEVIASVAPQFAHADSVGVRWRQRFQNGEASWDELELVKSGERKILGAIRASRARSI